MKNQNLKIAFLGTPEFGANILEELIKTGFDISGVITAPDKPVGRKQILTPPPVKLLAQKYNLPVFQPENKNGLLEIIAKLKPDLCIVAAFGMILTKEMLDIPKYGFLNVHPSLLPRWRGASPIQSAILAGDQITGMSIMLLNEKMDEGPTLVQKELKIENINYKELENVLSELGAKMLVEIIPKWINGEIKPQEQDFSKATYTKKITKEDGLINWDEPAETIKNKILAFTPWPGAYAFSNGKRLIITRAELETCTTCSPTEFRQLKIKRVKPEGKNEMDFADFLRGNPDETLKKFL